jgi:site-specific DNA recombinase
VLGDSDKVELVRRIFRDYLAGNSLRAIATQLNAENIPSPNSQGWASAAIAGTLKNVAYVGTYRWNASRDGKYNGIVGDSISPDASKG